MQTTQTGAAGMPARPPKPKNKTSPEHRLSMRLSDENLANADKHKARLELLYGTEVSRSQAIESLMTVGALVWEAVERTGSWSPTALIAAGEREQAAAKVILDEHLERQREERLARQETEHLGHGKKQAAAKES